MKKMEIDCIDQANKFSKKIPPALSDSALPDSNEKTNSVNLYNY